MPILHFKPYDSSNDPILVDKITKKKYNIKEIFIDTPEPKKKYVIGNLLSVGTYGCIYQCSKYILKKFIDNNSRNLFEKEILYQNEAARWKVTNQILLAYIAEDHYGFIMKKYARTLEDILIDSSISLVKKKKYLRQVKRILEKLLVEVGMIHKDTHLANFMVNNNNKVKLIDFGSAQKITIENEYLKSLDKEMFTISLDKLDEEDSYDLIDYWNQLVENFEDSLE